VMGKRMFDLGEQAWPEEAPFHTPVFVVTHEKRDPWERPGGTTFHFVNDGIEPALDQAREAAGDRDVRIAGALPVVAGEDIALLQYTSGSTGHPKGVVLTHSDLLANIRAMGQAEAASPSDTSGDGRHRDRRAPIAPVRAAHLGRSRSGSRRSRRERQPLTTPRGTRRARQSRAPSLAATTASMSLCAVGASSARPHPDAPRTAGSGRSA
jgi:AMP-binding enzyme